MLSVLTGTLSPTSTPGRPSRRLVVYTSTPRSSKAHPGDSGSATCRWSNQDPASTGGRLRLRLDVGLDLRGLTWGDSR